MLPFFVVALILIALFASRPSAGSGASSSGGSGMLSSVTICGDSHMEVMGPMIREALAKHNVKVAFEAHRGWSTKQMADAPILGVPSGVFVLETGTNDVTGLGTFLDASAEQYQAIADKLEASKTIGSKVLLVSVPALKRSDLMEWPTVRDNQREIASNMDWNFFDSSRVANSGWYTSPDDPSNRGVHFDSATYRKWADAIASSILAMMGRG